MAVDVMLDDLGNPVRGLGMCSRGEQSVITINRKEIKSEEVLRKVIWHEMGHWLWNHAGNHPRIAAWKEALIEHFAERTDQTAKPIESTNGSYKYLPNTLISNYAAKVSGGITEGVELPTVYLEKFSEGGVRPADWDATSKIHRVTFDLVFSILGDKIKIR